MADHLSDPLGQDVLLIKDPPRRADPLLSNLPREANLCHRVPPSLSISQVPGHSPTQAAALRDASLPSVTCSSPSPASSAPGSLVPPSPAPYRCPGGPRSRSPPSNRGSQLSSTRAGGPDSPVPTRSPRPAARGWQRSRSAPTEGTSARSARAPLRVQTGAGLPPRAGMPSRMGPEVPPPCAPPPSCLGSRGVFSLVILHPGAPSPTVRSLDTETPLLTPCGEPQDADPGPCPHSLVES